MVSSSLQMVTISWSIVFSHDNTMQSEKKTNILSQSDFNLLETRNLGMYKETMQAQEEARTPQRKKKRSKDVD